jgi:acetoin utilization protein AcuB
MDSMSRAFDLMRSHGIRHVPIVEDGEVVGIVSDRDLHMRRSLLDVNPCEVPLAHVMCSTPYTVTPETPLAEAARVMAEQKYGAALVARGKRLIGVLTTVDALHELERRLTPAHVREK